MTNRVAATLTLLGLGLGLGLELPGCTPAGESGAVSDSAAESAVSSLGDGRHGLSPFNQSSAPSHSRIDPSAGGATSAGGSAGASSNGAVNGAVADPAALAQAAAEVTTMNAALNARPGYALSGGDLDGLVADGLLSADEARELQALASKN